MFTGKKIKALLKEQGISITDFAEEIGENRSLVTSYLNDKLTPSVKFLYKVIAYFPELDLNYLFRDVSALGEETPFYEKSPQRLIKEIEERLDGLKQQLGEDS